MHTKIDTKNTYDTYLYKYILKYIIYTNSDSKINPCITRRQSIVVSILSAPETGTSSHSHIAQS